MYFKIYHMSKWLFLIMLMKVFKVGLLNLVSYGTFAPGYSTAPLPWLLNYQAPSYST